MFVVFRCTDCGRFLYQERGTKTRECPCGKRVEVSGAVVVAEASSHEEARLKVQALQEDEGGEPHFRRYG